VTDVPPALESVLEAAGFEQGETAWLRMADDEGPAAPSPPRWTLTGWMPERFELERYDRQV
jgi:hypothetical protein